MNWLTLRHRSTLERGLAFALLAVGIALFDLRYHEFWRDEVGALLEARAVPWWDFIEAMRIEGVPPLFHVLLKVFGFFLPNPLALVTVGAIDFVILLGGTYQLLLSISKQSRASFVFTLALATTYVYAYELGVVIRQYALGLGLAFASWAFLRRALESNQRRDVYVGTATAALAALSSAHSACLAGGVLLSFGCWAIWSRRPWASWRVILLTLPCFAFDAYLAAPYAERTPEANVVQAIPIGSILPLSLQAIVEGIMPSDWWRVEAFVPAPLQSALAILRSVTMGSIVLAALLVVFVRLGNRHGASRGFRFDALTILSSWVPLLIIIVFHYWGSYRHHIFLGVPAVVVLVGHAIDARIYGMVFRPLQQTALILLFPWFLFQGVLGIGSFVVDVRYPFSGAKDASRLLVQNARVVTDTDWVSVGMLFWRPDIQLRSPSWNGRPYRFVRADRFWHSYAPIVPLVAQECSIDPERTYFAGNEKSIGPLRPCAHVRPYVKSPFETQPFTWELFDVFSMDCACVARKMQAPNPKPSKR